MVTHRVASVSVFREAGLAPEEDDAGVLCTDHEDRPLMVAPQAMARRLGLACRLAGVLVFDGRKRLWLRRRAVSDALFHGLWNVSASMLVRPDEAREEAALRALRELDVSTGEKVWTDAWIERHPLQLWQVSSSIPGCKRLHVTLFRALAAPATLPTGGAHSDNMLLTLSELHGLVEEAPELFSPLVRWVASVG